ncbi:23S rRNA (guanosine(2251)-2'-O)-methyltransferase RlmB [Crocinitomix algicola]|uniref:23S rRNA (guanosine(2251)-2'-O)-methyltransferase RlmB n=1 Tax=Crocinitomix algicola TaxID=1740263 RepID=UPI00082E7971|nr:23S rRNA (guanosine(2251)-2'-O)-methyltransferase RlmB [Crocinitomix algicola]
MYQNKKKFEDAEDIIYGVRAVIEAVKADRPINKIFIQRGMQKELFYELKDALADKKYNLQFVPIHKLNRLTRKNHQGVIAQVSPIRYQEIEPILNKLYDNGEVPLFLILDRLTDVRNFGAIARTAECVGVHAIIIPNKDSVSVTGDAVKTSAGALNKIPVCKVQDLNSVIHYLKESGVQIAASTEKTDKPLYEADFTVPLAIVMGSEEDGVSMKILAEADIKAKIPMTGTIDSLNVAVSAGIMMYEASRQRLLE